ncbi:hypothetical protein C1H57_24640 [Clostridium sp. 2-1]|nr:hypothetical protein C1H57_24640 [Clostridium sp. 2-1]
MYFMKNIDEQFISYNRSVRSSMPIYIVIHDTGDPGASAQNEHDYFAGGDRNASADFFIDSDSIIQIIDTDTYYSWHCGDGRGEYGITNSNSLGIEMCLEVDGKPSEDTVMNTVDLTRYLMNKYDIGINNVVRHYDASRKICPNSFFDNNWSRWYDFKDKLCSFTIRGEWRLENNKWWYKHEDGSCTRNGWEKINGSWYLFDGEGWMLYNWKKSEDKWYYLGNLEDGSMKSGWLLQNNNWYYLGDEGDGAMKTGWQKIDGEWYYFNNEGIMQTGWIKYNDKDYCLYSNGAMIRNCELYGYRFMEDGMAVKI